MKSYITMSRKFSHREWIKARKQVAEFRLIPFENY
jgi:hypothetical protein